MNKEKNIDKDFKHLPFVVEGESKEVRYAGAGLVNIKLKPTIYSFTHNRNGIVLGSDSARLRAIKALTPVLESAGVHHTYKEVTDNYIISQLVLQPPTETAPTPFRPADMASEDVDQLPKAPPIEVVVKRMHTGTPKHRYYNFGQFATRASHPTYKSQRINSDCPYPEATVRFDWRNPLHDDEGNRLADEVMSEEMADWFIDVAEAKRTAKTAFNGLSTFLSARGLELWDICFFITEDGKQLFGEVSPDCLRVRAADGSPLDKDVWRSGGSSNDVLQKWQTFADIIEGEPL